MDYRQACEILEEDEQRHISEGEMLAELGSSFYYGGAQGNGGGDAMQLAREHLNAGRDPVAEAAWQDLVAQARKVMDSIAAFRVIYVIPRVPAAAAALAGDDDLPF